MKKILIVSGTRPEIIKLAPVYHAFRTAPWAEVKWLHTGQHDEMAQQIMGMVAAVRAMGKPDATSSATDRAYVIDIVFTKNGTVTANGQKVL